MQRDWNEKQPLAKKKKRERERENDTDSLWEHPSINENPRQERREGLE